MGWKVDIRNGTSGAAAVTGDEEKSVFSLFEICVGGLASSAGDVFHWFC